MIGAVSAIVAISCGVPDHKHNTTDIQANNNTDGGSGACTCKEPTNTLKLIVIEETCGAKMWERINNLPPTAGILFKEAKTLEGIVSAIRTSPNGTQTNPLNVTVAKTGEIILPCSQGENVKARILVR